MKLFLPLPLPCNVVPLFELPVGNNKHPWEMDSLRWPIWGCATRQGMVFILSVLTRVYNFMWASPCYKQGIPYIIDLICFIEFLCTPGIQKKWLKHKFTLLQLLINGFKTRQHVLCPSKLGEKVEVVALNRMCQVCILGFLALNRAGFQTLSWSPLSKHWSSICLLANTPTLNWGALCHSNIGRPRLYIFIDFQQITFNLQSWTKLLRKLYTWTAFF